MKIDRAVPIPKRKRGSTESYPWSEMTEGDSFFVGSINGEDPRITVKRVDNAARAAGHRLGFKFTTRVVDGGARCWRTA